MKEPLEDSNKTHLIASTQYYCFNLFIKLFSSKRRDKNGVTNTILNIFHVEKMLSLIMFCSINSH